MLTPRRSTLGVVVVSALVVSPLPPLVAAEWVAMQLRVNGIDIAVRRAELDASPDTSRDAVARQVLTLWTSQGAMRPTLVELPDRIVIGRQRGVIHETVAVRSVANSQRIAIEYAAQDISATRRARTALPFVAPPGTQILQTVEFLDDPRGAREYVLHLRRTPGIAVHSLGAAMRASGWSIARRTISDRSGERAAMLFAERSSEQAELIARAEDDGVRIVLRVGGRAH